MLNLLLTGNNSSVNRSSLSFALNKTAKQLLRREHKGLSSPKEPGRSEDDCADNLRNRCENKHSGNLLKYVLANDEQWNVILRNYVI